MAFDDKLAARIRAALAGRPGITEKRMFGGIAFLRHGHMFVGVNDDRLMARVGKPHHADSIARAHVTEMDFTGKPLAGYVYVAAAGLATQKSLAFWLDRSEAFVATLPPKAGR